jgi:hypothetical protein
MRSASTIYADHGFNNSGVVDRDDLWLNYLNHLKHKRYQRLLQFPESRAMPQDLCDLLTSVLPIHALQYITNPKELQP